VFDPEENRKRTLSSSSLTSHLDAYFLIAGQPQQLISRNDYTVQIDETLLTKEFTKRERKKYKKDKTQFQ